MTTYREAIYMCLDLLKGSSDDFYYTEEHVAYLLDKFRAFVLKQRYGSDPKKHVPYSNYQTLDITIKNDSNRLISVESIPYTLQIGIPRITVDEYYDTKVEFTSRERLPFVGYNKFLKNIIYSAVDENNNLIVKVPESVDWSDVKSIKLTALFESPRDLYDDYMDEAYPVEEALVTTIIELVVKELAGSVYIKNDDKNNNRDDLADENQRKK